MPIISRLELECSRISDLSLLWMPIPSYQHFKNGGQGRDRTSKV